MRLDSEVLRLELLDDGTTTTAIQATMTTAILRARFGFKCMPVQAGHIACVLRRGR